MNILVVDDQKFNLIMAKDYIHTIMNNCEVLLCNSPFEVVEILENVAVDIILLDIVMPGMNGINVLQKIRERKEFDDIQIIMLTSLADKENFKQCFESGANDYVLKPIEITEFSARLKAAVKTRNNTIILKEMYEHIKKQNTELQILNRKIEDTQFHMIQKEKLASIGELAAGVAHEINNPIGFVGSNLETMQSFINKIINVVSCYKEFVNHVRKLPDNSTFLKNHIDYLETVERKNKVDYVVTELNEIIKDSRNGIERVAKIVQGLKSFARTGLENEKLDSDLNKIIEEAMLIVHNEAKYTIDINCNFAKTPDIFCNRGQIGQVVLNIMVNAMQAIKSQKRSDRGKIVIDTCQENGLVCCRITDDGPGINSEVLGKIFDPFFTTKDIGQGTGLGLSISYDIIVKKHNGEFLVESEPGRGATFTFKLPTNI